MTQPFEYDDQRTAGLISALSQTRFQTYLDKTAGDEVEAIRLYSWNTSVAASLYAPLQTLEVLLRNTVHDRLSSSHGPRWFDDDALLRRAETNMVAQATTQLRRMTTSASGRSLAS